MTKENQPQLDLSSHLDKPLDPEEIDARMRAEAPFMHPPVEQFQLLDGGPTLRDRLAALGNALKPTKKQLALGAVASVGVAAGFGALNRSIDQNANEHAQLAKQGAKEAHTYFDNLNGAPQSGLDARGNRIVFENGVAKVIPKSQLEQASGQK